MPAVKTFALYAAVAVLIDFLLQVTAFIALISLDQRRYLVGHDSLSRWETFNALIALCPTELSIGCLLLHQIGRYAGIETFIEWIYAVCV